ncbi:MAG: anhydro-N-acetylmuramic acid kinase [Candidatus Zixiibacteriota bacterium]
MTLPRILARKSLTLLGLNSGTSADGLDLAAVRITRGARGATVRYLAGEMKPYPPELRQLVLQTAAGASVDLDTVVRLDNALGLFFGRTAATFIGRLKRKRIRIDAIGSHGQTVRHVPQPRRLAGEQVRGSLQLGSPDQIAAQTGKVVVADFRQGDIADGGEGAPITTGAMYTLFGDIKKSRLIINIGGIANYYYLPPVSSRRPPSAADCGPGNSLSDILSRRLYGEGFDLRGARSARGQVCETLLQRLLAHPFFSDSSLSTGREAFGERMAQEILDYGLHRNLYREDMLATVVEFTAQAIVKGVRPILDEDSSLTSFYLTGGGRKNSFLVKRLRRLRPDKEVRLIDTLGISGDMIEAAAFAVMGEACLRSEPIITPIGGSREQRRVAPVPGRIVQPPRRRRT